jgi:hypothetical protein
MLVLTINGVMDFMVLNSMATLKYYNIVCMGRHYIL